MKTRIENRFQTANIHSRLANSFQVRIDNLLMSVRQLTDEHREKIRKWKSYQEYHLEEARRYFFAGHVFGKEYTSIKQQ